MGVKGGGGVPVCGGGRMPERAAHLVDAVLPWVPVRQWVLTVPYRLRYQMQGRMALGSRAGARVRRLGDARDAATVTSRGPRQAHLDGFDLHANVWVSANDRAGVERLSSAGHPLGAGQASAAMAGEAGAAPRCFGGWTRLSTRLAPCTGRGKIRATLVRACFGISLPRFQTRRPAADIGAELVIFRAELVAQRWFFVAENEKMESQPDHQAVLQHADVSEKQTLAKNQRGYSDVHGVAHVTIQAGDHQMLRRGDRRGRTQALQREPRERIQQGG